jgi:OPT family oligopeptide transporter
MLGCVIFFWVVAIAMHFSGSFYAEYLPMSTANIYDNTGAIYNVTKILKPDFTVDIAAYEAYSPLFLSTTYLLAYGLNFAIIICVLVHVGLFHGKEVWIRFKLARNQEDDVHMRLMKKYQDAPDWWYFALFVIMTGLSFCTIYVWDTKLTWWAFIVAMIIPLIWTIPMGMIHAITNIT